MTRLDGRPDLRVIDGGAARERTAAMSSSTPSPSRGPGATAPTSTVVRLPSSPCDRRMMTPTGECRVLVCGSRTWNDPEPIRYFLAGLQAEHPEANIVVAHGAAQGADSYAGIAAQMLDIPVTTFPADWERHGRRAGFLRNKQMVEEWQPHIVLALSEHPITTGTAHTVRLAQSAGITVYVIGHDAA